MPHIPFHRALLLIAAVATIFFFQLGAAKLWDRDEPRNSRASHEMLERGDWIVPTFNGELRDHKPILLYWGQMAAYQWFGESEFTARMPSALCALLTIAATGLLASRLSGSKYRLNQFGFWSAGVLATSLLFVMAGRAATPDSCLIAFSTLGIASLVIASLTPAAPYSSGHVGHARWVQALFGYTMLGVAMLAKGPVGLILPLAVVHVWWLICKELQTREPSENDGTVWMRFVAATKMLVSSVHPVKLLRSVLALRTIPGIMIALAAAVPWYYAVGVETNGAFLRGFFWEHNVGRATQAMEGHGGSVFYYPIAMLVGTFPWSLWLIPVLIWARRAWCQSPVQRQMIVLAAVWITVYIGAFSLASTKLPSYITPCYVGVALLVGGFLRSVEVEWFGPTRLWRRVNQVLTATVGLALIATFVWLSREEAMPGLIVAAGAGVVLVGVTVGVWAAEKWSGPQWMPTIWLVGAVLVQTVLFGIGASTAARYRSDLTMIEALDNQAGQPTWISIGGMEPSWVHYLGRPIAEIKSGVFEEETWEAVKTYLERTPRALVIVAGPDANQLLQERLTGSFHMEQVSEVDRFLRSGSLIVYKATDPNEIARQARLRSRNQSPNPIVR